MTDLLGEVLEQFTGGPVDFLGPPSQGGFTHSNIGAPAVVSWDESRGAIARLFREGYSHFHRFLVLPSRDAIRWLLPLSDVGKQLPGFQIYTPYFPLARVAKALTVSILARWRGWPYHRVLVVSKAALPLEVLVSEVTGEHQPVFALSVGTPNRVRKLSMLVMRPNGEVLGHIKLPLTEAATNRVRHEAATLERLWNFAALRLHIPKVLHAGNWGDAYILFQSCGPSQPGPVEFGPLHQRFLETLRALQPVERPGQVLVEEVAAHWRKAQPSLGSRWQELGAVALERANRALAGVAVRCGVMHGDFTPWNSRTGNGRLFLFDWESAEWQAPGGWDIFHFQTQVASSLKRRVQCGLPADQSSSERAIFLLYLLNSACQIVEEAPRGDIGLDCRRRLVIDELSRERDSCLS